MKIIASTLALGSQHERSESVQAQDRLRFERGGGNLQAGSVRMATGDSGARPSVLLALSAAAQGQWAQALATDAWTASAGAVPSAASTPVNDGADTLEPRMLVLARMVEALTGIPVRVVRAEDLRGGAGGQGEPPPVAQGGAASGAANGQRVGWSLAFDRVAVHTEREVTQFSAQGQVQTADGRTIAFQVNLQMQREAVSVERVSWRAGDAVMKDPLVLHFDGAAPSLTDTRFSFDLDADGQAEAMPFVGVGSGFLVLDRNANGRVDDGRELFGALSGNGFADLAALDSDGNGWIDEADPAFARLQVWQKDAQGQDHLSSLQSAGVGAVSLGQVASPFSVRGAAQGTLGEVRASGVYLSENGQAGVIQQIDLAV